MWNCYAHSGMVTRALSWWDTSFCCYWWLCCWSFWKWCWWEEGSHLRDKGHSLCAHFEHKGQEKCWKRQRQNIQTRGRNKWIMVLGDSQGKSMLKALFIFYGVWNRVLHQGLAVVLKIGHKKIPEFQGNFFKGWDHHPLFQTLETMCFRIQKFLDFNTVR